MPKTVSHLRLDPNRCDRCGRCESACDKNAIKVGASYIYVDWRACDGCYECVEACDRGAIERKEAGRTASAPAGAKVGDSRSAEQDGKPGRGVAGRLFAAFRTSEKPTAKPAAGPASKAAGKSAAGAGAGQWTPLEAVAVLIVVFAAFLAKDAFLAQESIRALKPSTHVFVRVSALSAYYAVQLGVLALIVRLRGRGLLEAVRLRVPEGSWGERFVSLALAVLLAAGTLVAGLVYAVIVQQIGLAPQSEASLADLFGPNAVGFLLSVVLVAAVAPIAEEIVFRGVLLDALRERFGMWTSIALAAATFSVFHVSWWTLVPTLVLGTAAGWLAVKRRSLWPAICLHALYNLSLVAVTYAGAL